MTLPPLRTGRLFPVLALLAVMAGATFLPRQGTAQNTDPTVAEQEKKIQRLKQGIDWQKSRMQASSEQESGLLAELERLDEQIREAGGRLAGLNRELSAREQRLVATRADLLRAVEERDRSTVQVRRRLGAIYGIGPVDIANALFSARSLPELLVTQEYLDHLLRHDRELLIRYRQQIETLENTQLALEQEKKSLLETLARITAQEKALADARRERMTLLAKVRTEKKLYRQAINELEAAADRLNRTMARLKAEAEKKKEGGQAAPTKQKPEAAGFAAQKGRLPAPVNGTVTTLFGSNAQGKFGIATRARGIDISTRPGAEVRAVYDGTVVYAGFLRGYGNLLIIDHGQQYYTLVSRAAEFFKQEGDSVVKGETIGVMSDEEGLLSEGLHFEVRRGTEPENPLQWLNNAGLTIRKAPARRSGN